MYAGLVAAIEIVCQARFNPVPDIDKILLADRLRMRFIPRSIVRFIALRLGSRLLFLNEFDLS